MSLPSLLMVVDQLTTDCGKRRVPLCSIVLLERMGDIVACSPAAKELRKRNPDAWITWFCKPDFRALVEAIPEVNQVVEVESLDQLQSVEDALRQNSEIYLNLTLPGAPMGTPGEFWPGQGASDCVNTDNYYHYGPLLKVFTRNQSFEIQDEFPALIIPASVCQSVLRFSLPSKYIVIHSEPMEGARDWNVDGWQKLIDECAKRVSVVLVGKKVSARTPSDALIDLRGRLSILETSEVVKGASLFVGVDSGPAHLANAVRTPSFIILGRYRIFDRYCPYTGFFIKENGATILQFPRECTYAPPEIVLAHLRPVLDSVVMKGTYAEGKIIYIRSEEEKHAVPEVGARIPNEERAACGIDAVESHRKAGCRRVRGWAFDSEHKTPPDFLFVCRQTLRGKCYLVRVVPFGRLERPDVAEHFGGSEALFTGWAADIPMRGKFAICAFFERTGKTKLLASHYNLAERGRKLIAHLMHSRI
jgi:heptosyltransferase-3